MFMRYRGGGIGHKGSRHWDTFLLSDSAANIQPEDEDEQPIDNVAQAANDCDGDGGDIEAMSDVDGDKEVEEDVEGEDPKEKEYLLNDKEDPIIPDEDEELDDQVLVKEGYGAL